MRSQFAVARQVDEQTQEATEHEQRTVYVAPDRVELAIAAAVVLLEDVLEERLEECEDQMRRVAQEIREDDHLQRKCVITGGIRVQTRTGSVRNE